MTPSDPGNPDSSPPPPPPPRVLPTPTGTRQPNEASEAIRRRNAFEKRTGQQPQNKKSGGGKPIGCCLGAAAVGLLLIFAIGAAGYWLNEKAIGRFEKQGFETVRGDKLRITEAPTKPTLYIAQEIHYAAPETSVPVAFVGFKEARLSGFFGETVYFFGTSLELTKECVIAKDVDVWARYFTNDAQVHGQLTGKVIQQD